MVEYDKLRKSEDLHYGVFTRDCYGLSKEDMQSLLLSTFENYNDALIYANAKGNKTAIHLTKLRVNRGDNK